MPDIISRGMGSGHGMDIGMGEGSYMQWSSAVLEPGAQPATCIPHFEPDPQLASQLEQAGSQPLAAPVHSLVGSICILVCHRTRPHGWEDQQQSSNPAKLSTRGKGRGSTPNLACACYRSGIWASPLPGLPPPPVGRQLPCLGGLTSCTFSLQRQRRGRS